MAKSQVTIYAGQPISAALEASPGESKSGRINAVVGRYMEAVARHAPTLTAAEWSLVCDALNGSWLGDEGMIAMLWAEIADAPDLGPKWDVDTEALAAKLRALDWMAKAAVVEIVERFWARADDRRAPAVILAEIGARIDD